MPFEPRFTITPRIASDLMRIEAARQAVRFLPITPSVLATLRETARQYSTHYSTMIEGNRLTQEQVARVIEHQEHFAGRTRRKGSARILRRRGQGRKLAAAQRPPLLNSWARGCMRGHAARGKTQDETCAFDRPVSTMHYLGRAEADDHLSGWGYSATVGRTVLMGVLGVPGTGSGRSGRGRCLPYGGRWTPIPASGGTGAVPRTAIPSPAATTKRGCGRSQRTSRQSADRLGRGKVLWSSPTLRERAANTAWRASLSG